MKRPAHGSTPKQYAYAQNLLGGVGNTRNEAARLAGFSPSVARKPKEKIESTDGFKNAMNALAAKSGNILVKVLHEFDQRDLTEFSNKELTGAVKAITDSWAKIDTQRKESSNKDPEKNPLRAIYVTRATEVKTVKPLKPLKRTGKVEKTDNSQNSGSTATPDNANKEGLDLDF